MIRGAAWEQRLLALAQLPAQEDDKRIRRPVAGASSLQLAHKLCRLITKRHSRTFYLSSALLPPAQKRAARALYAFCRLTDDHVDRGPGNRRKRFERWQARILHASPAEDDLVAQAWAETRARHHIPDTYMAQFLDGVAQDLTVTRYETFADLAEYCYGVAATVGLMTMHIVGFAGPEAIPYAVRLGVALQMTNILRDVAEDWSNGRLYLPREELAAFGLTESDIAQSSLDDRWRAFMQFQIRRTRQLYAEALPGITLLGRGGRVAIAAAAELYRAILEDIEAHDYDVFSRRAYVSSRTKLARLPGIWWRTVWRSRRPFPKNTH